MTGASRASRVTHKKGGQTLAFKGVDLNEIEEEYVGSEGGYDMDDLESINNDRLNPKIE